MDLSLAAAGTPDADLHPSAPLDLVHESDSAGGREASHTHADHGRHALGVYDWKDVVDAHLTGRRSLSRRRVWDSSVRELLEWRRLLPSCDRGP